MTGDQAIESAVLFVGKDRVWVVDVTKISQLGKYEQRRKLWEVSITTVAPYNHFEGTTLMMYQLQGFYVNLTAEPCFQVCVKESRTSRQMDVQVTWLHDGVPRHCREMHHL